MKTEYVYETKMVRAGSRMAYDGVAKSEKWSDSIGPFTTEEWALRGAVALGFQALGRKEFKIAIKMVEPVTWFLLGWFRFGIGRFFDLCTGGELPEDFITYSAYYAAGELAREWSRDFGGIKTIQTNGIFGGRQIGSNPYHRYTALEEAWGWTQEVVSLWVQQNEVEFAGTEAYSSLREVFQKWLIHESKHPMNFGINRWG